MRDPPAYLVQDGWEDVHVVSSHRPGLDESSDANGVTIEITSCPPSMEYRREDAGGALGPRHFQSRARRDRYARARLDLW